jgi:CHAD domain-containing protein
MSYRLSIAEDVGASVRGCAREQLERAVEQLEQPGDDLAEAIHDARKRLKKTRALLRLVRPALGTEAYGYENAALRDAGRALSGARDADALVATAERLAERFVGQLPAATFGQLRDALAEPAAGAEGTDDDGRPAALATLREAVQRIGAWPLDDCDWDTVVAGAKRAYARGRRDFARAQEQHAAPEQWHDFRKRAKDLWYHGRLLTPVWPVVLKAETEEAHRLTELLGDDHDLAVLIERLDEPAPLGLIADPDRSALRALAVEQSTELRTAATWLGRRLYAARPKAFARRLDACVETALAERRAEGPA